MTAEPPVKRTANNKRGILDAAALRNHSKKRKVVREAKIEETVVPLPAPNEMPPVEDDGNKPSYSFAMLIGMAILRAPTRCLTTAQICKWISATFKFYSDPQIRKWHGSIRYNLSVSKSFSKQERPKDDPGKGHCWIINAGFEEQYLKVNPTRRSINPESLAGFNTSGFSKPEIDSSDSDATIPCSDPAAHDGHDSINKPPPRMVPPSPPPAAAMHSSRQPHISRSHSVHVKAPPRGSWWPSNSSRTGGCHCMFDDLDDKGYYSSIESSMINGNPLGLLISSKVDLDRPSMKGRAEGEIARIRGSSFGSPSKTRSYMKQPSAAQPISLPLHPSEKLRNPLTPGIVFERPDLPPASASPNTNLRIHRNKVRELVGGSPDRSLAMWVDTSVLDVKGWSPAISIPNNEHVNLVGEGYQSTFDTFHDFGYSESPLKSRLDRQRPRMEGVVTTSHALADITGSNSNFTISPTPNWNMVSSFLNTSDLSPLEGRSLLKQPQLKHPTWTPLAGLDHSLPGPGKENTFSRLTSPKSYSALLAQRQITDDGDIFSFLHSDESEPGVDVLQGFEKIGSRSSAVAPNGSPQELSRHSLTRSNTVRF